MHCTLVLTQSYILIIVYYTSFILALRLRVSISVKIKSFVISLALQLISVRKS